MSALKEDLIENILHHAPPGSLLEDNVLRTMTVRQLRAVDDALTMLDSSLRDAVERMQIAKTQARHDRRYGTGRR